MRVEVVDGIAQEPGEAVDVTSVEGKLVALADHDLQRGPGRGSAQFVGDVAGDRRDQLM
ncbi:hypothetical protein ACFWUQ_01670 [Streptomyces sp. NPDC058662]|uniref:hypothetical protein n=1 Tax=Streptomyces sp. NPDC058662 TaxID=3346583 RepID=UPI0036542E27